MKSYKNWGVFMLGQRYLPHYMIAISGLVLAAPALACSDLPNICQMNSYHHEQMVDYGRQAAEDYYWQQQDEREYRSQRYDDYDPAPYYDPMQTKLSAATATVNSMSANMQGMEKLMQDPRYQTYLNGGWEFFQDSVKPKAGEYCAAFYWKKDGFVKVSGPGGEYQGGLLTFWGADIPKPAQQEIIKVVLYQNDEAPQTVKAFNYVLKGYDYGAIAFAVPAGDALFASMEDKQRFELKIDGKSVAKVDWHDGLKARDQLKQCVQAKQ